VQIRVEIRRDGGLTGFSRLSMDVGKERGSFEDFGTFCWGFGCWICDQICLCDELEAAGEKESCISLTFALINEFGEGTFGNERHVGLFMTRRFKGVDTGSDANRSTYVRKGMDKCHRPTCISDL